MRRNHLLIIASVVFETLVGLCQAQAPKAPLNQEQLMFSIELDSTPVRTPIQPSVKIMQLISQDPILRRISRSCHIADSPLAPLPGTWFVGSRAHLGPPSEIDLIVMAKNGCLLGANVGPFWVLRQTSGGHKLVLSGGGHNLNILDTRSKGFRDIEIDSVTATVLSTTVFKFDGAVYVPYKKKQNPLP